MYTNEDALVQKGSLPLPSAALVIDIRGIDDDDVVDRLRIEVEDLANELRVEDIHHWRYLTEFLSFTSIEPMSPEEADTLRPSHQSRNGHRPATTTSATNAATRSEQKGLTGRIDPSSRKGYSSSAVLDGDVSLAENRPFGVFQQNLDRMIQEVDRIRNNHIVAVTDLDKAGTAERSIKDATVRIIFLTDVERPASLSGAAAYAAYLKEYYGKRERAGHQPLISTTVLCLNNSGEAVPPRELIQGLLWEERWDHLDSLILSEKYREDAALIGGSMQAYLAELLLYVLLIVPPLNVGSPAPGGEAPITLSQGTNERRISLPSSTYLVGLAAMEHSARWGRRFIDYGLVKQAVEKLQDNDFEDEAQCRAAKQAVDTWLSDWCLQVRSALPDKVPGNIPALEAIPRANKVAKPASEVFTIGTYHLHIGKSSVRDLQTYLGELARTYVLPLAEREAIRREAQEGGQEQALPPTLQDAINSIPQIQQRLRDWEDKDPALKQGTPLVNAQVEAQRILSQPDCFIGVSGAVPRARRQLKELGTTISGFQNEHEQTSLDLQSRRAKLEAFGTTRIDQLQSHIESWPFLGSFLRLKRPMAWLSLLLLLFLTIVAALVGFAWLHHLIFLQAPSFLQFLDASLLGASTFTLVSRIVPLLVVAAEFFTLRHQVLDKGRSALRVEFLFWASLVAFAFFGLLVSFTLAQLVDDPLSAELLHWLSFLPLGSYAAFIFALLILLTEMVYFVWWYNHLRDERARIADELRCQHRRDIDEVMSYIANSIALQLLLRAGLTDGKGGPGRYYERVDRLYKRLNAVLTESQRQQELAKKRLVTSISQTQQGAATAPRATWLNLRIREEYLDVQSLADGYNRLKHRLIQEPEELKEFSELLLLMMGEEAPNELEQMFRERPAKGNKTREQRYVQVLMETLVAMALRFSVVSPSVESMTQLIERYESLDSSAVHSFSTMRTLIGILRGKVSETTFQPLTNEKGSSAQSGDNAMATNALAAWGRMLWEHRDPGLDKTLTPDGVLPKLLERGYDAHIVKRFLGARTSLFGRSILAGQVGESYLLLSPSLQSQQFRQSLNLQSRQIVDFPDEERLLLLYVQHYVGEPLFLSEPPAISQLPPAKPQNGATGDAPSMSTPDQTAFNGHQMQQAPVGSAPTQPEAQTITASIPLVTDAAH